MDIFKRLAHEENKCVIIVPHSPQVAASVDEVYELAFLRTTKKRGKRGKRRNEQSEGQKMSQLS